VYKKLINKIFPHVINQAENEDEKEVVIYGLEIMLSTVVNLLCLLFVGILSGNLLESFIFLIFFCLIRGYSGGFHASTHLACFSCSMIIFLGIVLINPYISQEYNQVLILGTVLAYTVIFLLAPILNGKRNFSLEEVTMARKKMKIILVIELIVLIVLYQINFEWYKFAAYALITEGVLEIMGKIKYWELNKKSFCKQIMHFALGVSLLTGGGVCLIVLHEPEMPRALKEKFEKK